MATSKKSAATSRKSDASSKSKSGSGRKATRKSKPAKALTKKKSGTKRKPSARTSKPQPAESSAAPNAMRLTFSYTGDEVKLVSQQAVNMVVPPTDPVKNFKRQKGFWAELKSEKDKTLYRQVLHNPTRNDAEVFSDDPYQSISREPAPERKGVFVVVVPKVATAAEVALSRSPDPRPKPKLGVASARSLATAPAKEIMRFKLKK